MALCNFKLNKTLERAVRKEFFNDDDVLFKDLVRNADGSISVELGEDNETTENSRRFINALSRVLALRVRGVFANVTDSKGVTKATLLKDVFQTNANEIERNIIKQIEAGNYTNAYITGAYGSNVQRFKREIESIRKDTTLSETEKKIKYQIIADEFGRLLIAIENLAKDNPKVAKISKTTRSYYEELLKSCGVERYTPSSFKIPAFVQIHYDTGFVSDNNLFIIKYDPDDYNVDIEQKELNDDLIDVLREQGKVFSYAFKRKNSDGSYTYLLNKFDPSGSPKDTAVVTNINGKDTNSFHENQLYVMDSKRFNNKANRNIAEDANQFLNQTQALENQQPINKENSGQALNNTIEELRVKISENIAVTSNREFQELIRTYNEHVDESEKINPSLAFAKDRIDKLGNTTEKIVVTVDENGNTTVSRKEHEVESFVTKSFSQTLDAVITSSYVDEEGKAHETVVSEYETSEWTIVRNGDDGYPTTDNITVDHFFDGNMFIKDKYEDFLLEYFNIAFDRNTYEDLYKAFESHPEVWNELKQMYGVNNTGDPMFIPIQVIKDTLYREKAGNQKNNRIYNKILETFAFTVIQAKYLKTLHDNVVDTSNLSPIDIEKGTKEFAERMGFTTYDSSPKYKLYPNVGDEVESLADTNLGVLTFEANRDKETGKFLTDPKKIKEAKDNNRLEVVTLNTTFYAKEGDDNKLLPIVGEVLENDTPLSFNDVVSIKEHILAQLYNSLTGENNKQVTLDKFKTLIAGNTPAVDLPKTYEVSPQRNTILLVPKGKFLVPTRVTAKTNRITSKKDYESVNRRLQEEIAKADKEKFELKASQFSALAPFMLLYHIAPEYFAAIRMIIGTPLADVLNQGYSVTVVKDGKEEILSIGDFINNLLRGIESEQSEKVDNDFRKKLKDIFKDDIDEANKVEDAAKKLMQVLGQIDVLSDPQSIINALSPIYNDTLKKKGIEKDSTGIDDISIVSDLTNRVLDKANSEYKVLSINKNGKKVNSDKFAEDFTKGYVEIIRKNMVANQGISHMLNASSAYKATFIGERNLILYMAAKELRRTNNNPLLLKTIEDFLNKKGKDKKNMPGDLLDKYDEIKKIGLNSIEKFTGGKLGLLLKKSTVENLWNYHKKVLLLRFKNKDNKKGVVIPLRLEYRDGKVVVIGDFRNLDYNESTGKYFFNEERGVETYRGHFVIDPSDFNENILNTIAQSIANRKYKYYSSKESFKSKKNEQIDAIGKAIIADKGAGLRNFFQDWLKENNDLATIEQVPFSAHEESTELISRKKLNTNLNTKNPFRVSILKGFGINSFPIENIKDDSDTQTVNREIIEDEETPEEFYIANQNESFTNDYEITENEIKAYLDFITGGQVKIEDFDSETIQNVIRRAKITGTPLGVAVSNLIALDTNSAGIFYHEVFHQVFNGLMYPYERQQLLDEISQRVFISEQALSEFKKNRGIQDKSDTFAKNKYLEEHLADMFGQYKIDTKERKRGFWRRMLGDVIVDFFNQILDMIGLIKNDRIRKYFDKIDSGYYSDRVSINIETPLFSIIQMQNDNVDLFALEHKTLLKNKMIEALNENKDVKRAYSVTKERVKRDAITQMNLLISKIKDTKNPFSKFEISDYSILQDQILLPLYTGIERTPENADYFDALKILNKGLKDYFDKIHTNFFRKVKFISNELLRKDWYNNTSQNNLETLYKEILSEGLPELGELMSNSDDLTNQPGEEQDEESQSKGNDFDSNALSKDPSQMSKFIKRLVSGYNITKEVELGDSKIKIPTTLDALTVYNSLLKLFADKDINTKSFQNDTNRFFEIIDFITKFHYDVSSPQVYSNFKNFRDFLYNYFGLSNSIHLKRDTIDTNEEVNGLFIKYEGNKIIPNNKVGEMRKFLYAFNNNIIEFGLAKVTKDQAYLTNSIKAEITQSVLKNIKDKRKTLKNENSKTKTLETINSVVLAATDTTTSLIEKTQKIKSLLDSIKITFSAEFIYYSLIKSTNNDVENLKYFHDKFQPITFTNNFFEEMLALSETSTVDQIQDEIEKHKQKILEGKVRKAEIFNALYASSFFDANMSTLIVRGVDKKPRYLITKDFHIHTTFKGRRILFADGIIEGERGSKRTDISDTTSAQYFKFASTGLWGHNDLGSDRGYYLTGQMETTNTKILIENNTRNFVTTDGEILSDAIDQLYKIVETEINKLNTFINKVKNLKEGDYIGVDGYTTPIYNKDGSLNYEKTLTKNKLGRLFETNTLISDDAYKTLVNKVHEEIRTNGVFTITDELKESIKDDIKAFVNYLAEDEIEFRKEEKIPIPVAYKTGYGNGVEEDNLNKHIALNSLLNNMIYGREVMKGLYGDFGATFNNMESDYIKRAKALAALGAAFSEHNMVEIEDPSAYMVFFENKKLDFIAKGSTIESLITDINNQITGKKLDNKELKGISAEDQERIINSNDPLEELSNLFPKEYKTRVRNITPTDGESYVSTLHRIQQLHDLARVDSKIEALTLYMLSEGFLWKTSDGVIVRYSDQYKKEYDKAVAYSHDINANFGKFKSVGVFKELFGDGTEGLKYIKQSEQVLNGSLVRKLNTVNENELQQLEDVYTSIFNTLSNGGETIENRFGKAKELYKSIESFYGVIPGQEKLYERFKFMTNNDIGHLVFKSASKTAKTITKDLNKPIIIKVPDKGKFLQQEVPNWKEDALSGTQMMELILADQKDDTKVFVEGKVQTIGDIKDQFVTNIQQMFNINKAKVLEILGLYSKDNKYNTTELDINKLGEYLVKTMTQSGKDDFTKSKFLTKDGKFIFHNDTPDNLNEVVNMMTSFLNKPYKLKKNAESYALTSSDAYTVAIDEDGVIVPLHLREVGKQYTYRKLETTRESRVDEKGNVYEVEVHECVVSSTRDYEHLLTNKNLTHEEILRMLPMNSPLREMLGYRIPTENKRSMKIFKIIDFLPGEYGSTMITTDQSMLEDGHDFDIDKQYTEKPYEMKTPQELDIEHDTSGLPFDADTYKFLGINPRFKNLSGLGSYIQIGYNYTLEELQYLNIHIQGVEGEDILRNQDHVDAFNQSLQKYAINKKLEEEAISRIEKEEKSTSLSLLKATKNEIKSLFKEVGNLNTEIKDSIGIYKSMREIFYDAASPIFSKGVPIESLMEMLGDNYVEVANEIRPYIVSGEFKTQPYGVTQDRDQTNLFNKIVRLAVQNQGIGRQQIIDSLIELKGLSQDEIERLELLAENYEVLWNKILKRKKDEIREYNFHMFPLLANKQIELIKVLLSNDHTLHENGTQREETDMSHIEIERDVQKSISPSKRKGHFMSFVNQMKNYFFTVLGKKNIGITASSNKQNAVYARFGLSLPDGFSFQFNDKSITFNEFGKINKDYIDIEKEALAAKVAMIKGDGTDVTKNKLADEYNTIMTNLIETEQRTSKYSGISVSMATDAVKNDFSQPLNLSKDIIAIDALLIQLGIPSQIRVGFSTHPIIKRITELIDKGLEHKLIIKQIQLEYNFKLKNRKKEEDDKRVIIPTINDLFTESKGKERNEALTTIVSFYFHALKLSGKFIPINRITSMTKGVSNKLSDYPDYVKLAKLMEFDINTVLRNSSNDKDYVEYITKMFNNIQASDIPIIGLDKMAKDPLIREQVISFFDYFLYVMYKMTPLKSKIVQEGMFHLAGSGLPVSYDDIMDLTGQHFTLNFQANYNEKKIPIRSTENDVKVNDLVGYEELISVLPEFTKSFKETYPTSQLAMRLIEEEKGHSYLGSIPTVNGFAPMNPQTKHQVMMDVLNHSQDAVNRVSITKDGVEKSLLIKDYVSLLFYVDMLASGMLKTNTSLATIRPFTMLNANDIEVDQNLFLESKLNDILSRMFMDKKQRTLVGNHNVYLKLKSSMSYGNIRIMFGNKEEYPKLGITSSGEDKRIDKWIKIYEGKHDKEDIIIYQRLQHDKIADSTFLSEPLIEKIMASKEVIQVEGTLSKTRGQLKTEVSGLLRGQVIEINGENFVIKSEKPYTEEEGKIYKYTVQSIDNINSPILGEDDLKKLKQEVKKEFDKARENLFILDEARAEREAKKKTSKTTVEETSDESNATVSTEIEAVLNEEEAPQEEIIKAEYNKIDTDVISAYVDAVIRSKDFENLSGIGKNLLNQCN